MRASSASAVGGGGEHDLLGERGGAPGDDLGHGGGLDLAVLLDLHGGGAQREQDGARLGAQLLEVAADRGVPGRLLGGDGLGGAAQALAVAGGVPGDEAGLAAALARALAAQVVVGHPLARAGEAARDEGADLELRRTHRRPRPAGRRAARTPRAGG